ncbi:hypothetical protein [Halorubrum trueperi]|uniref:Rpa-associated protein n=1 Tax=Halorubrum trueperi TaxID=2004704 RepID=A0ABD5UEG5_9EURY
MSDDGPGAREVAHRVFAAEFDDATLSYSESDEERAPNYVVTPTGARVNRLFVAGVLTEVERVNDETRRGRVVDPSGAFVTYAGQYQPEAQAFLERADPPSFVALTGKARTFEPEDSDRVFTSVRPESLNDVDADTRDRWVVSAAEATLDRLAVFAKALDSDLRGNDLRAALEAGGAPASLAAGIPKAIDHYDTSTAYVEAVRRMAIDALELIAGDRDEVRAPDTVPNAGEETAIGPLPETDVTIEAPPGTVEGEAPIGDESSDPAAADSDEPAADDGTDDTDDPADTDNTDEPAADVDTPDDASGPDSGEDSENVESEGLGDFQTGADDDSAPIEGTDDDSAVAEPDAAGDDASAEPAADEMYEIDDEEREEIESEFGTDFSTGTEVDDPGEADIDVPDADDLSEMSTDVTDAAGETDEPADSTGAETDDSADPADETDDSVDSVDETDDIDLEAAVVEAMDALDDGDGAARDAVVQSIVDEHGVDADAVEDAIQDALMSGKCYEPGDGVLKPI